MSAKKEHADRMLAAELAQRVTPLSPQRCTTGVRRQFLLDPPVTDPFYYEGTPYAAAYATDAASAARFATLPECADIVRKHYPKAPRL